MSRERIIEELRFVRKEYMYHKSNENVYPLKRALTEFFAKECLRVRKLLDNSK